MITQIYSIQTVPEALACADAGVDYIGFAAGTNKHLPAEISLEEGQRICAALKGKAQRVALAVANNEEEIISLVDALRPDMVQVCGNDYMATPGFCETVKDRFGVRVIQAIGITGKEAIPLAIEYSAHCDYLILDSVDPSIAGIGAAGFVNDWDVCAEIVQRANCPVILAGGLGPNNVAEAIAKVRPFGVDSLTRTSVKYPDGRMEKDIDKVCAFVENTKVAADALGL